MLPRLAAAFARFAADERGVSALVVGVSITMLAGFTGLGVDVGLWYMKQRQLQLAADAGALAGGSTLNRQGQNQTAIEDAVADSVADNGFPDVTPQVGTGFSVCPSPADAQQDDEPCVEVGLAQPQPLFFARLFLDGPVTARARAVAQTIFRDEFCLLGLDGQAAGAVDIAGSADLNLECGIAANSAAIGSQRSQNAVTVTGTGNNITTTRVSTVGGIGDTDPPSITAPKERGRSPIDDPFENLPEPSQTEPCVPGTPPGLRINSSTTLTPGRYCGGIRVTGNNTTVTFDDNGTGEPFIIDGGDFEVVSGRVETAASPSGSSFVLTDTVLSPQQRNPQIAIGGNIDADLRAAETGDYEGILFYQVPRNDGSSPVSHTIRGDANSGLDGVVYLPDDNVTISGSSASVGCTKVVASTITVTGDQTLTIPANNCDNFDTVPAIGRKRVVLVE